MSDGIKILFKSHSLQYMMNSKSYNSNCLQGWRGWKYWDKRRKVNCGKTLVELPFPISTSRLSFCLAAANYSLAHFKNTVYCMKGCKRTDGRLFGWKMSDKAIVFCNTSSLSYLPFPHLLSSLSSGDSISEDQKPNRNRLYVPSLWIILITFN